MRLVYDLINRRMEQYKDLELNNENFKAIWHFYQVYSICCSVLGYRDPKIKKKIYLIVNLIRDPDDVDVLSKLKQYVSEDGWAIEKVLSNLEIKEETNEVYEDFYPDNLFAVNLDDRGE
jgi:hypothetical protein